MQLRVAQQAVLWRLMIKCYSVALEQIRVQIHSRQHFGPWTPCLTFLRPHPQVLHSTSATSAKEPVEAAHPPASQNLAMNSTV